MTRRRWRLLGLFFLLLALPCGVRWLLGSPFLARQVAAKLEAAYGGHATVGGADVGYHHTVLTDVELFEKDPAPGQEPWLKIARLEADVPLLDLLQGGLPSAVRLSGVTVTLRFDGEGRLATVLPSPPPSSGPPLTTLPEIAVSDSRVVMLGTEGRRLDFHHVDASIKATGTQHDLKAHAATDALGAWTAAGKLDLAKKSFAVTLRSDADVPVTQPRLNSLPFVPPGVWRAIQAEGDAAVVATLDFDWGEPHRAVEIALTPRRATVHVSALDLTTTATSGRVEFRDGLVTLRRMEADAHGGHLTAEGEIDLRGDGIRVNLPMLTVANADLRQLPKSWGLPPQLQGRLFASTALQVTNSGGKLAVKGAGQGEIRDALLGGQPTDGPIGLVLGDQGGATRLDVHLRLSRTDLGQLAAGFDLALPDRTAGKLTADVLASLPLDTITDPRTHQASGTARLDDFTVAGVPVRVATTAVRYGDNRLTFNEVRATLPDGGELTGSAAVGLADPLPFEVHLKPAELNLAVLEHLTPPLQPPIRVSGTVTGTVDLEGKLRPFDVASRGTAHFRDLAAAGWSIPDLDLRWHSDDRVATVESLDAQAYGGRFNGSAELPLAADAGGRFELRVQGLDLHKLVQERFGARTPVVGSGDGTVRGTLGTAAKDGTRDVSVDADVQSAALKVDRLATRDLTASLHYRRGLLTYRLAGRALGGSYRLDGEQAVGEQRVSSRPQGGRLRLSHIDLGRLPQIWSPTASADFVRGSIDADLTFRLDGNDFFPVGKGRVVLSDFGLGDNLFATQAQAEVSLDREAVSVREISTTLAQGTLQGRMVIFLREPERSWFKADLLGAELSEVLQPWPGLATHVQGTVDARMRGMLGRQWAGSAEVTLSRAKLADVEVAQWDVPLRWTFDPSQGSGTLNAHDGNATVAQGRATTELNAVWGDGLRLDGKLQFVGVDLRQALPAAKLGTGRVTGKLEVSGENVRDLNDLRGTLSATLQQAQALETPVLRPIAPLLGLKTTATFQTGELRARLGRGIVYVERFTLLEGPVQLFGQGNVTLGGRVNLDVTVNSGKLTNIAAALGWRVPQTGSIAAEMLRKATAALSPRLLHIRIGGTFHEPSVQAVPLPELTEQGLRFFAGIPVP
jgi:hypothetical protein